MSTYKPGEWIPPHDHIALCKARYIVGAISFAEFERAVTHCVRGDNYAAPLGPLGSQLSAQLLVTVES